MITQLATLDGAIAAVPDPKQDLVWIVEGGPRRLSTWSMWAEASTSEPL